MSSRTEPFEESVEGRGRAAPQPRGGKMVTNISPCSRNANRLVTDLFPVPDVKKVFSDSENRFSNTCTLFSKKKKCSTVRF